MYDQDLIIIYLGPFRLMYVVLSSADDFLVLGMYDQDHYLMT